MNSMSHSRLSPPTKPTWLCVGLPTTYILIMFLVTAFFISSSLYAASEDLEKPRVSSGLNALEPGDLYALVVGVSVYREKSIPNLQTALKDAKDVAALLKKQERLFRETHVKLLINEQATKANIEKELYYGLRRAGKNDIVILFLSGHGADDPYSPGEFFFVAHDSDPTNLEGTAVRMTGLRFAKRLETRRMILIADACHAGGFSRQGTKSVNPFLGKFLMQFRESSGRVIITSSKPDEFSLESPDLENSVFTYYLLEGLKGKADNDHDGVVTVQEAYNYVYGRTKDHSHGVQHPQYEGKVVGLFPISVVGPSGTRLELVTNPPEADVYVSEESTFKLAGKTNAKGRLLLRDLPINESIIIRIAKVGWKDKILDPVFFTNKKLRIAHPPVKLEPSLSFMVLKTNASNAVVSIGGKVMGKTENDKIFIMNKIQTGIPHEIALEADGFIPTKASVTIPVSYDGKIYKSAIIYLKKKVESDQKKPAQSKKEKMADVKIEWKENDESAGRKREQSLINAVKSAKIGQIKKLLAEKVNVNTQDDHGWTPLMHACSLGNKKVLTLLIANGANVDMTDWLGWTALMVAASKGDISVVKLLLEKGADKNVTSMYGDTAALRASLGGYSAVVKLLNPRAQKHQKALRPQEKSSIERTTPKDPLHLSGFLNDKEEAWEKVDVPEVSKYNMLPKHWRPIDSK